MSYKNLLFFKILLFAIFLIFYLLIFSEFWIRYIPQIAYALPFLHQGYSTICHQQQEKLLSLGGSAMTLLCSRCTGIYTGGIFASVLLFWVNIKKTPHIRWLFVASIPMVIDVVLSSVGLYEYSKTGAFLTGFLLGSVGFFYFYKPLENLIFNKESK